MSQTTEQSPINTPVENITEEHFYKIIDRLKTQRAIPHDAFPKDMPFFNFSSVSKESQVKDLFQDVNDPLMYRSLFKNILTAPEEKNSDLISKRLSAMQVMGFAQIILYKVLPCPCKDCPNRAREVATQNQYKDYEYECPFYHHDKDQRRMVLAPSIDEEFIYKANYYEEGKNMPLSDKDRCSHNYFESLFHPLYYKMFKCKRQHCNFSQFCPFFHSEEEKRTWDRTFSNFIRKDRVSYVKDKQKYLDQKPNTNTTSASKNNTNNASDYNTNNSNSNTPESKILRSINPDNRTPRNYGNNNNNNYNQNRSNYKQKSQNNQGLITPSPNTQQKTGWRSDKILRTVTHDYNNHNQGRYIRKESGESNGSNSCEDKENVNINLNFGGIY